MKVKVITMESINMKNQRESVKVLQECIDLQIKKSQDYQNPNSNVVQADYYRRGIDSIHDMIHTKVLRAQSLIEAARSNKSDWSTSPAYESLEDSYKDLINYCSFAVSYLRYQIPGQLITRNIFNECLLSDEVYDVNVNDNPTVYTMDMFDDENNIKVSCPKPLKPGNGLESYDSDGLI